MAMTRSDNLSAAVLSSVMNDSASHLRNPFDALALLCHACMVSTAFRLVGLGEDHKIEPSADISKPQPLPKEWNETQSSDYAFRYSHPQSSMQYLVKVSRLGGKAVINALGIGDDKVASYDVAVRDFVSQFSLPFTRSEVPANSNNTSSLQAVFISPGRIADFAALMKLSVIAKLAPGINKEGYQATSSAPQNPGRESQAPLHDPLRDGVDPGPARPHPLADPLGQQPPRPFPAGELPPPDFEDEHGIFRPPGRGGYGGARRPLDIGERDLYPPGLGPNDPFRVGGGIPPLGGIGGGGMHPTFDDPLFGGDGGNDGGLNPRAPPGARYDPVGPGDGPMGPGQGPRFPGRGGGFGGGSVPGNPFGRFGGNDFI